ASASDRCLCSSSSMESQFVDCRWLALISRFALKKLRPTGNILLPEAGLPRRRPKVRHSSRRPSDEYDERTLAAGDGSNFEESSTMSPARPMYSAPLPPGYRASGVLLHVTSLPSPYGIGDMGPSAFAWVDRLAAAGQAWWQLLPVGPTGFGDSPYQALSSF